MNRFPQQGTDLVPHETIQNPAGLLSIHLLQIDPGGVGYRLPDRPLRNLVEHDPLGIADPLECLGHVPGNGFPLAVGVCRQNQPPCRTGGRTKLPDEFVPIANGPVYGLESVRHIDAEFLLRQVTDVSHAGHDLEVFTEYLVDRPRLGRRLDHHQRIRHIISQKNEPRRKKSSSDSPR